MFSKKNLLEPSLHVRRLLLFLVLQLDLDLTQGFWMMMNLLLCCHRNIGMNLIVRVLCGCHGVEVMRVSIVIDIPLLMTSSFFGVYREEDV